MARLHGSAWRVVAVAVLLTVCGGEETLQPEPEPPNNAPRALGNLPDITLQVGETRTFGIGGTFVDPDGDALTYSATSSNTAVLGVSISGSTVTARGVSAGQTSITVTARDPRGGSAQLSARATVEEPNRVPVLKSGHPSGHVTADTVQVNRPEDQVLFSDLFEDPDGDALAFTTSSSNEAILTVSSSQQGYRLVGVTPGSARATLRATDTDGLYAELHLEVTVLMRNLAPEVAKAIPDFAIEVGQTVTIADDIRELFSDPNNDSLTYTLDVTGADHTVALTESDYALEISGRQASRGPALVYLGAEDPAGFGTTMSFEVYVATDDGHSCGRGSETPVDWTEFANGILTTGDEDCFVFEVPANNPSHRMTVWTGEDPWSQRRIDVETRITVWTSSYYELHDGAFGVATTATSHQRFIVKVRAQGDRLASGHYRIYVDDHGGTLATATDTWTTAANGDLVNKGYAHRDNRYDTFTFDVPRTGTVTIRTTGNNTTNGSLYDSTGEWVAGAQGVDSGSDYNFEITRQLVAGKYYIIVSALRLGNYELRVSLP